MDRIVSLEEATEHLQRLVQEVEGGEEVLITRAGAPVARLVPIRGRVVGEAQQAALSRTQARMARGWPLHAGRLERDSLHER